VHGPIQRDRTLIKSRELINLLAPKIGSFPLKLGQNLDSQDFLADSWNLDSQDFLA